MTEIKLQVGSPHVLRDHLRVAIGHCTPGGTVRHTLEDALAQIEQQVQPAVKEPTAFGSILRANCEPGLRGIFWQKSPMHGKHYWESTGGALALWSELTDVEVLRVGIGEPQPLTEEEIDKQAAEAQRIIHAVNSVAAGEIVRPDHQLAAYYDEMNRLDVANAQTDAYTKGAEDMRAKVIENLRERADVAVMQVTKIAYRNAIRAVEETRP